jgi:hypothetical protein
MPETRAAKIANLIRALLVRLSECEDHELAAARLTYEDDLGQGQQHIFGVTFPGGDGVSISIGTTE